MSEKMENARVRTSTARLLAAVLTTVAASGCHRATAYRVLAASDLAADRFAAEWEAATDARIASCREQDLPTPAEREVCLGEFGPDAADRAAAALAVLVAAQAAVRDAAACEERVADCASKADWRALALRIVDAWRSMRPLVVQSGEEAP